MLPGEGVALVEHVGARGRSRVLGSARPASPCIESTLAIGALSSLFAERVGEVECVTRRWRR